MQQTIHQFTEPTIGQSIWNVRHVLTSMLKFELGKEIEPGCGEYRYWISCCHWWLKQGKGEHFKDIVNSASSEQEVAKKITLLEGKKLLNINFDPSNASTFFDFEDEIFLEVAPYAGSECSEQWYLFKATEVLVVKSDGSYSIQDPDA